MNDVRDWTDAEVLAAIDYIKTEAPEFWPELQRAEREGAGLGNGPNDPGGKLGRLLIAAHPNSKLGDIAFLTMHVRRRIRTDLGLSLRDVEATAAD